MKKIIIILLLVVVVAVGCYLYISKVKNDGVAVIEQKTTTRLEGTFSYNRNSKPILEFSAVNPKDGKPIFAAGDYRPIEFTFTNQNDALSKFGIDISKLQSNKCEITSQTVSVIEVTGYDAEKAEKTLTDEVFLESIITEAEPKVECNNL